MRRQSARGAWRSSANTGRSDAGHPHLAAARAQRARRWRRRPGRASRRTARASCPRSSGRSRTRAGPAAAARRCRAGRRPARRRTRRARPSPSRRRSWRGAPGRRPPRRTRRSCRSPCARRSVASWVSTRDVRDVVGVHDRHRVLRVALGAGLVAEDPERDDARRRAGRAGASTRVQQRAVRGEVVGVELDPVDRGRARVRAAPSPRRRGRRRAARPAPPSRPAASRRATASPISLRPPSTSTVSPTRAPWRSLARPAGAGGPPWDAGVDARRGARVPGRPLAVPRAARRGLRRARARTTGTTTPHECAEAGLAAFVAGLDAEWAGLSLTMPLKRVALEVADEVSPLAAATGAANTLVLRDGRRCAENTDVAGIVAALRGAGATRRAPGGGARGGRHRAGRAGRAARAGHDRHHRAGPLGGAGRRAARRGGAARACARRSATHLADPARAAGAMAGADVVVSTLPGAGRRRAHRRRARAGRAGRRLRAVADPVRGRGATAAGARVVSGLEMLLHQAVAQVALMTGRPGPVGADARRPGRTAVGRPRAERHAALDGVSVRRCTETA